MIILVVSNTHSVADGYVHEWFKKEYKKTKNYSKRGQNYLIPIGTEVQLNEFRIAVKKGIYKPKGIMIKYKDINITIDSDGRLDEWPKGMFDTMDNQLNVLLGWDEESRVGVTNE